MESQSLTEYAKKLKSKVSFTPLYHEKCEHHKDMYVHLEGTPPDKLLSTNRPNEDDAIKKYRLACYEPETTGWAKKIVVTLSRIKNGKNWSIEFKESGKIAEGEELEEYSNNLPLWGELESYIFEVLMPSMLKDPNGVLCIKPYSNLVEENEFTKPYPVYYSSSQVVDKKDDYVTILLDEKNPFNVGNQTFLGNIYEYHLKDQIIRLTETGRKGTDPVFSEDVWFVHNLGFIPVYTLGGVPKSKGGDILYESFISGILPSWNKAVRLLSDLDAQYVLHMFLEKEEFHHECDNDGCQHGTVVVMKGDKPIHKNCGKCKGTGFISTRSPFGVYVKKEKAFTEGTPSPSVQYIQKPTEIVTIVQDRVNALKAQGYESINMEFLAEVPTNQSGKAKEVDRTELNAFIVTISDRLFSLIDNTYKAIAGYRYKELLQNEWVEYLPIVTKPIAFDVLTVAQIQNELSSTKDAGMPSMLTDEIIIELSDKRWNDEKKTKKIRAIIDLDPLRGKTEQEKSDILLSGGVTESDYIVSSNIKGFITRALLEDEDFLNLDFMEQMAVLEKFAKEKSRNKIELNE